MRSENFKCGYIAIIGRPNVGKSTLLNQILDIKLSIVSPKAQTTRKRVLGILNSDSCQAIFLDTPGMIKPRYELQSKLMEYVNTAVEDADLIALLLEPDDFKETTNSYKNELEFISKLKQPKVAIINKIDSIDRLSSLPIIEYLNSTQIFDEIVPVSALKNIEIDSLVTTLIKKLPFHPPLYDPDILTEQPERFFVSEIIREHIFKQFKHEVPYSTEVVIDQFSERENRKDHIQASILVDRKSQKGILIGKAGANLKKLGSSARRDIEIFLDRPVFLELFVKVKENWRDNPMMLKHLGY